MAADNEQHKFRILMFPWLAHEHITPFLELSKRHLTTNNFTIHLCSTAVNLDSIKSSINDSSMELIELQMPSSTHLPPHLHTTRNLPSHLLPSLLQAFQESSSSFSDIFDSLDPHLLIYDVFQAWAPKIAASKCIPSVLFLTSGAAAFSFFHHVRIQGNTVAFPFPAIHLPDHEMDKLNRVLQNATDNDSQSRVLTRSTDIVLLKSSKDLEGKYLDYLSVMCKKHIVCTGPLISDSIKVNDDESLNIMKWLDGKKHASTIYISFGSECFLSREQIAEIAKGLLLSDANFLWVIRFPSGMDNKIEEELPEGFLEAVKEKGLIVQRWAPQTKILGHPSIAAFVGHCGWGSVMESIYFGVPVIAMPMKSEQPINAQMVVEAGAGVEVGKDGNGMYVGEEEVGEAIKKVMVEREVYEGLRNTARRLSEAIREKEDRNTEEVAEQLLRICMKNKKFDASCQF